MKVIGLLYISHKIIIPILSFPLDFIKHLFFKLKVYRISPFTVEVEQFSITILPHTFSTVPPSFCCCCLFCSTPDDAQGIFQVYSWNYMQCGDPICVNNMQGKYTLTVVLFLWPSINVVVFFFNGNAGFSCFNLFYI